MLLRNIVSGSSLRRSAALPSGALAACRGSLPTTPLARHALCQYLPRAFAALDALTVSARRASSSTSSSADAPTAQPPTTAAASESALSSASRVPGVPTRATAGVSEEYLQEWVERVHKAQEKGQIVWNNPGAYAQVSKLPEEVIRALPPPPRPLWPMAPSELTWRYTRSFSFALVFVLLALYIHTKQTVHGNARWAMERDWPTLTRWLVNSGILPDYSHLEVRCPQCCACRIARSPAHYSHPHSVVCVCRLRRRMQTSLDRPVVFRRVFARYADADGRMPRARALALLAAVHGTPLNPAAANETHDSVRLTFDEFEALALESCHDLSGTLLYLALAEVCGITAVAPELVDDIGRLYDELSAVAAGSDAASRAPLTFTVASLARLANDLGFYSNASTAYQTLSDSMAVASGAVEPLPPASETAAAQRVVPLQRTEFVDFVTAAAAAGQVDESRLADYLRVFRMLHLSGMREQAGVRSVTAARV
ncbi:MAG: hypothetical protein EOO41_01310 [Methanobacteriota archaeon]|nr:MAG: hypothetical protein EOO41_01310 [Euryarchaeota archaeon]